MARIVEEGARPPLRKRAPGFPGLAAIVISQQVSTASAKAIQSRVEARFPALDAATILGAEDEELRVCGLSAAKMRALRAAAEAILAGELPLAELPAMPAEEAHAALVAVKGIGPWTADIYLLFCLGHPDAFPAGDLALQEAARIAYGLDARPRPAELVDLAESWRPWRGVAAKTLWAYYGLAKSRADPAAAAGL
ncbi:MAG: DNA-3-methyladenine glycosylase 2 family protein [Salinarimonadaceae bacterium]|nr:MAG: DNA-3-methyladenine glycosylase 2 family protein [Salinarimonadaceae bacterium]